MPKEGISVYFSITDNGSPTLTSIGDKTKSLDKATQSLAQSTAALEKNNKGLLTQQGKLKSELEAATREVKEAQKAFNEYGDELSAGRLDRAIQDQAELKLKLLEVDTQLKANRKTYNEYVEDIRKGTSGSDSTRSGESANLGMAIISGTIGDMLSDSLGGAIGAGLSSAIGVPLASLASNSIGDAIEGGLAGFSIGGVPGAVIGGTIGGAAGLLSGATEIFQEKDEAFKDYYGSLYDDYSSATDEMVSGGSTTAGSREQTRKAFAKRFGSEEAAVDYLNDVQDFAAMTNYDFDEITGYAKNLLNSYGKDEVFGVLQSLSDATAGLSLSSSDVSMMISGLSRMRTTGKTTQEYLNYFSERGVDVYTALSDALGVDKSKIAGMVTKGDIEGEFAAQAILSYIDDTFGGLSEDLMSTYDAMTDNLQDITTSLEAAGGEGYNELRKEGLAADTEAYSGPLGEAIEEMNRISGENRAYLENLSGQYQREALSAVLIGSETSVFSAEDQAKLDGLRESYLAAQKGYKNGDQNAGLLMESYRESAEAIAQAAYESSEQYQTLKDVELDQLAAIRDNTEGLAAATLAYRESQGRSKGMMADFGEDLMGNFEKTGLVPTKVTSADISAMWKAEGNSHAFGLNRVPYDNYPALLHQDERILTASEARAENLDLGTEILDLVSENQEDNKTLAGTVRRDIRDNREKTGLGSTLYSAKNAEENSLSFGMNHVPYDIYPLLLHRDEQILTATETRSENGGRGTVIQISVTGNHFTGAGEDLADQVAEVIVRKLEQSAVVAAPR